jgi:hypothetical protein
MYADLERKHDEAVKLQIVFEEEKVLMLAAVARFEAKLGEKETEIEGLNELIGKLNKQAEESKERNDHAIQELLK